MQFLKKEKTITAKLEAIAKRLVEVQESLNQKSSVDMITAKDAVSKAIGNVALLPSAENTEALKRARAVLSRLKDAIEDLQAQEMFLKQEQKTVSREYLEVRLQKIPDEGEQAAKNFNSVLEKSLQIVEELRSLHSELLQRQKAYHDLIAEDRETSKTLGKMSTLEIKTPLGMLEKKLISIPSTFDLLLAILTAHAQTIADRKKWLAENPDWAEKEKARQRQEEEKAVGVELWHNEMRPAGYQKDPKSLVH